MGPRGRQSSGEGGSVDAQADPPLASQDVHGAEVRYRVLRAAGLGRQLAGRLRCPPWLHGQCHEPHVPGRKPGC
eukprot:2788158-Alexandrium_andersonii.AAC.1